MAGSTGLGACGLVPGAEEGKPAGGRKPGACVGGQEWYKRQGAERPEMVGGGSDKTQK